MSLTEKQLLNIINTESEELRETFGIQCYPIHSLAAKGCYAERVNLKNNSNVVYQVQGTIAVRIVKKMIESGSIEVKSIDESYLPGYLIRLTLNNNQISN